MANRRGADYIEALRDGREVWHAGRRIEDVTIHSGFSGTIKTLADVYDKQHLPEYKDIMTVDYEGERIFVYKDPRLLAGIHYIHTWGQYSTMLRLITKLEGFLGVAQLLTQWSGRNKSASSQILLSSFMQDIEILRSCIQVAEAKGYRAGGGTWTPLLSAAYRIHSIESSDRAERTMEGLLTSTLMLSGGVSDLNDSKIGPLIDRYFRGGAPTTKEHLRLIAVAADMVMSPFGKRSQLYERLQSGEVDQMRQRLHGQYKDSAPAERMMGFVKEMV
jgi:aromatic ring hydroxylase